MACENIELETRRNPSRTGTYCGSKQIGDVHSLEETSQRTSEWETFKRKLPRITWPRDGCQQVPRFRPLPLYEKKPSESTTRSCLYNSAAFQHFQYSLDLMRDCESRVELVIPMDKETKLPTNVMVQINIIGEVTENDLKLLSKRKGKQKISEEQRVWDAKPLICFQNARTLSSAIESLRPEDACHKIIVTSNNACSSEKIVVVPIHRLQEAITECLEEPLHRLLEKWEENLKEISPIKQRNRILSEIVIIRKQMMFEENKEEPEANASLANATIVPSIVKEYLFSNPDVTSFGIWQHSSFKVFVKKATDKEILRKEIEALNEEFFKIYTLKIENKRIKEELTMKQGDFLLREPRHDKEHVNAGTLGGFVIKPNDPESKFALTCSHLFPNENQTAFAGASLQLQHYKNIGKCVFAIRERDFAAIEIDESVSNECDVIFRREDGKKTNAHLYEGCMENLGFLHKVGAGAKLTKGTLLSEEFYIKNFTNKNNRESLFFVRGIGGLFSGEGDSGSLVFSRPRDVQQNYINIIGMVFGNNVIKYDDVDEVDDDDSDDDGGGGGYDESKNESANISSRAYKLNFSGKKQFESENTSSHSQTVKTCAKHHTDIEDERVSSCYRINSSLDLFKRSKRVPVKFKDDLSSSSDDDK
uniref:Uncharacterized protein LOC111111906 isoform X2 n=1 Tax=Crassostrea virginica TaxID=6565 RepID=A0A8B8BN93_CRAVI|nr:uncharacterized protein LOC111111906 isoform X2 [Crassostrea virginica]